MKRCVWMLAMAAIWILQACSPKSRDLSCTTDGQCESDEACINKVCTQVECKKDADCGSGEVCQAHTCKPEGGCTRDEDCAPDEACIDGVCTQVECTADGDCAAGEYCRDYECVPEVDCTSDAECQPDEICEAGTCTQVECKQDADCEASETCADHFCVGGECDSDGDCDPGEICEAGSCVSGCNSNRDCPDGMTCLPEEGDHGLCVTCVEDADCPGGERCIDHECVPYCESNADCAEGYCDVASHACVECLQDPHCAGGTICEDHECVTGCRSDTDCPAGHICEGLQCVPGCHLDADCPDGQICENQACRDGCRVDADCPSGVCDLATLTCLECDSKDDCELGHVCVDGQCVPGCEDDRDCPDGVSCDPDLGPNGTCVECNDDADCLDPDFPRCVDHACSPECVVDSDCPAPGDVCIDYHCQPPVQECDLHIQPDHPFDFGNVRVRSVATMTITLSNEGGSPCHISDVELVASLLHDSYFVIQSGPELPLDLAPRGQAGSSAELVIEFAPAQAAVNLSMLWITSDDPDLLIGGEDIACYYPSQPVTGQACMRVTGNGVNIDVEAIPTALDFGLVQVGCNSAEETVRFYNLGTAVTVSDIRLADPADGAFEIFATPATPYTFGAGGSFEVGLRYHPPDLGHDANTLVVAFEGGQPPDLNVMLTGTGTNQSQTNDQFVLPSDVMVDALWVVDNSGSMGEEQEQLAENFGLFIDWAIDLGVDFHIGVIATEVNEAESGQGTPPRDVIPGVLIQAPGRPAVITPDTPDLTAAFADNVRIGICCSDEQEAGLQASHMALSPPLVDDENAGFLREDAKLYIIYVSDEEDQSYSSPDFFVDYFLDMKGTLDWLGLSAICGDLPSGCSSSQMGDAEAGTRYIEVQEQTGGIFQSICQTDWSDMMFELGENAFAPIRTFPLSRPADTATITVQVNGITVPRASCYDCADGWTYHSPTNSVFLGDSYVPSYGSTVQVQYTALCL